MTNIVSTPNYLEIYNKNATNCPVCDEKLVKGTKKVVKRLITFKCNHCIKKSECVLCNDGKCRECQNNRDVYEQKLYHFLDQHYMIDLKAIAKKRMLRKYSKYNREQLIVFLIKDIMKK